MIKYGRQDCWVLGVGLLLTLLTTALVHHLEDQSAEADFAKAAEQRLILLDTHIQRSVDQLLAVGSFFDANPELKRAQFRDLVAPILARHPTLQALEWVPLSRMPDLPKLESMARAEGYPQFFVREQAPDKSWVRVGHREDYYPVWYVEPLKGNEKAFGFDLGSNPARRAAIEKAIATRSPVATSRITLVQEVTKQFGFLLFRPVFSSDSGAPKALKGLSLAVYRIGNIVDFDDAKKDETSAPIQLMVFDRQAKPGEERLYPTESNFNLASDISGFAVRREIQVGDRTWEAVAFPRNKVLEHDRRASVIVGVAGVLFSILLSLFYRNQATRKARIERLVAERTEELETSRAEMNRARDEAVHANRMKSVFLASMGHEFRTPMNAILGLIHVLDKTSQDVLQKDYYEKMRLAARRLLRLIDDILDISRIEAGKLAIEVHEFRLESVLQDVLMSVAGRFKGKPLELIFDIDPEMPARFKGDSMRITQILTNLIDNAAKFTSAGSVTLRLHQKSDDSAGTLLMGSVSDTGMGISEEDVGRLFKPFTQAESTHEKQLGGTGLGLVICKQLLGLMGGHISVISRLGLGSSFKFDLVLEAVGEDRYVTRDSELESVRIILIDHDEEQRRVEADLLRRLGVQVTALVDLVDESSLQKEDWVWISNTHPRKKMIAALLVAQEVRVEWLHSVDEDLSSASLKKPLLPSLVAAKLHSAIRAPSLSAGPSSTSPNDLELSEELRNQLMELSSLLDTGDLGARSVARALAQACDGHTLLDLMKEVEACLDNFDFSKAREIVASMLSKSSEGVSAHE